MLDSLLATPKEIAKAIQSELVGEAVAAMLLGSLRALHIGLPSFGAPVRIRAASVAEFWARTAPSPRDKHTPVAEGVHGIDIVSDKGKGVGVQVGLARLLPYAPLTPAHPLARPAYSPQGWDSFEDREGIGASKMSDYDIKDNLLYGDRVVRLPLTKKGKYYYAGLYDHYYGVSNVAIPVLVPDSVLAKAGENLQAMWAGSCVGGCPVKIRGNLLRLESLYSASQLTIPKRYRDLPCWGIEATSVKVISAPRGATHIAAPLDWTFRGREAENAPYFNVQEESQFAYAEDQLDESRRLHHRRMLFDYDLSNATETVPSKAKYNVIIREWMEETL